MKSLRSLLATFRFWGLMSLLLTLVSIRRIMFGPKRRTWSFVFELVVSFMKYSGKISKPKPESIEGLRRRTGIPPKIRARAKQMRTKVEGVRGEWMIHDTVGDSPRVILYLHGGAYCLLSSKTHRSLTAKFSKMARAKVLAIDYRLAPENPFPCGLEDSVTVYRWLINPTGGNIKPNYITIAGDSAGGGLTLATLCKLRDENVELPAAAVLISPWVDLECKSASWHNNQAWDYLPPTQPNFDCARMYAGCYSLTHPLISPIHADLKSLPPLLIQVGEVEVLHDEAIVLARRAREAGLDVTLQVYPDMVHVFQAFGSLVPQIRQALTSAGEFIQSKSGGDGIEGDHKHKESTTTTLAPIPNKL